MRTLRILQYQTPHPDGNPLHAEWWSRLTVQDENGKILAMHTVPRCLESDREYDLQVAYSENLPEPMPVARSYEPGVIHAR